MTITNGYATLLELKAPDVLNFTSVDHDVTLESVIEAISRAIDNYCGRHFYQAATATRYFTTDDPRIIAIDDVYNTTSLVLTTDDGADGTYENTWASTDYNFLPANAVGKGFPFTSIEVTPLGNYRFPLYRNGIKLVANYGWAATPKPVNRACVLWATRLFKRYVTPLGQAGATAVGNIIMSMPSPDPDIKMLLMPYVRLEE